MGMLAQRNDTTGNTLPTHGCIQDRLYSTGGNAWITGSKRAPGTSDQSKLQANALLLAEKA